MVEGSPQSSKAILQLDSVSVAYQTRRGDTVTGCEAVSFAVPAGGALGLVGESGHGKSTILSIASAQRAPDAGGASFANAPYRLKDAAWRATFNRAVQLVGQNPYAAFNPRLTILPQIAAPARFLRDFRTKAARDLAVAMLARVGLDASVGALRPSALSGGMLQRAAIARALICEPQCLILDEPTASLSPEGTRDVLGVLQALRRDSRCAILVTSHDLDVIAGLCEQVMVVYRGSIVDRAAPQDLGSVATNDYTRLLVEAWRGKVAVS